ncbi:MAG: N-acetylneuraminate synthase family protein [Candidatus Paceibacterota bacterium]
MTPITIGTQKVGGKDSPCFIIAEIGINHNGSVEIAKRLIDLAVAEGCQAVKFQKRTVDVVYSAEELAKPRSFDKSFSDHAFERIAKYGYDVLPREAQVRLAANPEATTNGDLKYALEFNEPEYREIDQYCREKGVMWTASPWDVPSVEFLAQFDLPFYKIASASLTDEGLLRAVAMIGRPVILSTGMSTMAQVRTAVGILESVPTALLHCVSTYPAKDEDLNLRVINSLQAEFPGMVVGYSGHENGSTLSVCAVAMGARVIERHITLDRTMPGSDQAASLEPFRLNLMASNIRRLELALGSGTKQVIPAEVAIQQKLRRVQDF